VRVLVSNRTCEAAFNSAGIDCGYLPKCADERRLEPTHAARDIEFGFIGRTRSPVYSGRRTFLQGLQESLPIQVLRTAEGDFHGYNALLHRIRFFISADIGFQEYMFKNFEAMAAGCVLIAKRQPEVEQTALGFEDMTNVVLYDEVTELIAKARLLQGDPARADAIAASGRSLVLARHTMARRAEELFSLLQAPIRQPVPLSWREHIRLTCLRTTGRWSWSDFVRTRSQRERASADALA
jgi:hypothetical protein